jgi:hypothetical protein
MKIASLLLPLLLSTAAMAQETTYTVHLEDSSDRLPNVARPLSVTVVNSQTGQAVTEFDSIRGSKMHLMLVDVNLRAVNEFDPTEDASGKWTENIAVLSGLHYLFAVFEPKGGSPMVLRADKPVAPRGMQPMFRIRWQQILGPVNVLGVSGKLELGSGMVSKQPSTFIAQFVANTQKPITDFADDGGVQAVAMLFGPGGEMAMVVPNTADQARLAQGQLVFNFTPPAPGVYRVFIKLQRKGQKAEIFPFAVEVP